MTNIKSLVVFVLAMMLGTTIAAAATTISKVVVRDCDKQKDTSITVTSGGTLDSATLPKNWTLDFVLYKTADVVFSTDGGKAVDFDLVPYCPAGHNTPLNLAAGTHKISVTIDHGSAQIFTVIVGTPSATAAAQIACVFGSNGEGVTYPSGDPVLHPQLLAACKSYGFQYFRLWTEQPFSTPFPSNYWSIPLKWKAAGVNVLAVINFQNSPGYAAPSDADWLTKINSFPTSAASGVWGVCLGNECDLSSYYTGSVAQLAHLMKLAFPVLHNKGYVVIAPSFLLSLAPIQQLQSLQALGYCDYLDFHVYEASATTALSKVDAYKAYCTSVNKPGLMSECGIRGSAANLSAWAVQCQTLFGGLENRSGIYLQFPLFWLTSSSDPLCQQAPLSKSYGTNAPFTALWQNLTQ